MIIKEMPRLTDFRFSCRFEPGSEFMSDYIEFLGKKTTLKIAHLDTSFTPSNDVRI